jgi:hypothetical protein
VDEYYFKNIISIFTNFTLSSAIYIFFGATLKSAITTLYNLFASKKIAKEIERSQKIKQIVQRSENARTLLDADDILITQIHNGGKWYNTTRSILKLTLFQELSLNDPYGKYHSKIFARQINKSTLSNFFPLIENFNERIPYDIQSVNELKNKFIYYRHLKVDKVNYIITVKISYNNNTLGYLFILFRDGKIPERKKEIIDRLKIIGEEVGSILN